jgi:hypothetical protein
MGQQTQINPLLQQQQINALQQQQIQQQQLQQQQLQQQLQQQQLQQLQQQQQINALQQPPIQTNHQQMNTISPPNITGGGLAADIKASYPITNHPGTSNPLRPMRGPSQLQAMLMEKQQAENDAIMGVGNSGTSMILFPLLFANF